MENNNSVQNLKQHIRPREIYSAITAERLWFES